MVGHAGIELGILVVFSNPPDSYEMILLFFPSLPQECGLGLLSLCHPAHHRPAQTCPVGMCAHMLSLQNVEAFAHFCVSFLLLKANIEMEDLRSDVEK